MKKTILKLNLKVQINPKNVNNYTYMHKKSAKIKQYNKKSIRKIKKNHIMINALSNHKSMYHRIKDKI